MPSPRLSARVCLFCLRELDATEGHMAFESISGTRTLCHPCVRCIVQQFVGLVLTGPR